MTATPARFPSRVADERLVYINMHLAQNVRFHAEERARHTAARIATTLGAIATTVSLYDVAMFTGLFR